MPFPATYTDNPVAIRLLDDRLRKMVVMQLKKTYLWYRMTSAGNMLQIPGEHLEIPFYLTPPNMGKWIGKGDILPDTSSGEVAMGYATNRFIVVPLGIDLLEQMVDEGNSPKLYKKLQRLSTEAAWAMVRSLSTAMWSGTGGKQPDGLSTFIEAAAPSAQTATVLGVDKATKPWMRNQAVSMAGNFGDIGVKTSIPNGFLAIINLQDLTTIGTLRASDLVTTQAIFNIIRRAFLEVSTPMHMIADYKSAQWGFDNFQFNGSHVAWDPDCPADKMYALHIDQRFDASATGDPRDTTKVDGDLERLGTQDILDLNGTLAWAGHPSIQMRTIQPRTPYRTLQQTSWKIHSFNLVPMRLADMGVLYSASGSGLSTWS